VVTLQYTFRFAIDLLIKINNEDLQLPMRQTVQDCIWRYNDSVFQGVSRYFTRNLQPNVIHSMERSRLIRVKMIGETFKSPVFLSKQPFISNSFHSFYNHVLLGPSLYN
jgi:hypothetical protein